MRESLTPRFVGLLPAHEKSGMTMTTAARFLSAIFKISIDRAK